jgi:Protein of unknwon function (DUF3310)
MARSPRPKHYQALLPDGRPIEVIEVIAAFLTPEEYRGFLRGTQIKYALRQGRHDDGEPAVVDAAKGHFYSEALLDHLCALEAERMQSEDTEPATEDVDLDDLEQVDASQYAAALRKCAQRKR